MKYTKIAFTFALALGMVVMTPSFASAQTVGGTVVSAPATQDNGTTAGAISAPATQDNGTTAGNISTPATQDNGTTAGTIPNAPVTQDNGTTAGTISNPPATQDNGTTAGTVPSGSTGSTGTPGASVGSGGGSSGGSAAFLPLLTNISQCNFMTQFMKFGAANASIEVTKLQNFLKFNEGMSLSVTGIFDAATLSAVHAFQTKYASDILAPWGARASTGFVYITTTKKINELYCKQNFALTPAQVAEITAYRTAVQNGTVPATGVVGSNTGTPGSTVTGTTSPSPTVTPSDSQVGAAAQAPVMTKIWNFIKRIFGR